MLTGGHEYSGLASAKFFITDAMGTECNRTEEHYLAALQRRYKS
jgi:hypothetical protein